MGSSASKIYQRLPHHADHETQATQPYYPARPTYGRCCTKKIARLVFIVLIFIAGVLVVFQWNDIDYETLSMMLWDTKPPLYDDYHRQELELPQHNLSLPYPEGNEGRYVNVANHVTAIGWGNVLQNYLFDSYIVYKTGRSFVFTNYTWNTNMSMEYSEYNGHLIPSRIPLTTMITGPTTGGPYPPGDATPRSVVQEYWEQACPNATVIHTGEVNDHAPPGSSIGDLADRWVEKLKNMPDRCVEIDRDSPQMFGYWLFGEVDRLLSIWPSLSSSPIITQFTWSPLIQAAFTRNFPKFADPALRPLINSNSSDPYAPIPGLLAMHIRRGDFDAHCEHLARWSASWNGFNRFPSFPDQWTVPEGAGDGENPASPEGLAAYMKACFPTIEQIADKVEEVTNSDAGKDLKTIFIMTNGKRPWVKELKDELRRRGNGRWERIASSRDLRLSKEQLYVAQAVDMLIGHRSQVLIGNGFSSLTSNIVMLRMARHDQVPGTNRFWL